MITLIPVTIREANEFVRSFHRHSAPTAGAKFAIGVTTGEALVGGGIIGRPVARMLNDGRTAEVLRVCTAPAAPKNVCSMLYGAAWRSWRAMGGGRLVTYTLQSERGASVKAAGFRVVAEVKGNRSWASSGREREWHAIDGQAKFRWERCA